MKEKTTSAFSLVPVCKPILWGGTRLAREYGKNAPVSDFGENVIGETWELVVNGDDQSLVGSGDYAGKRLGDVPGCDPMPVLIKYIDAATPLSVQVHPNKTEMWYIVEADPGARLVYGLKDAFDETTFRQALAEKKVSDLLYETEVHAGEVYFIPTGLVHALGGGILIAEIQQNSTETYRVYDYDRLHNGKPRELHVDKAMQVIRDFTPEQLDALRFSVKAPALDGASLLASCETFTVYLREKDAPALSFSPSRHAAVMCLDGEGEAMGLTVKKGETVFLPMGNGDFTVKGEMKALMIL